jgi:uncharacterized membrane protein YgcG
MNNCRLSARWQVDDIIHQLSQFPDPLFLPAFKPLCNAPGSTSYQLFKDSLCGVTDTYSGTKPGATTPCNSLSMGIGFNAKPGRLGDVFEVAPIVPKCIDSNGVVLATDPINDSCSNTGTGGGGGSGGDGAGGSGGGGVGGAAATGGSGGTKPDAGTPDAGDAGK